MEHILIVFLCGTEQIARFVDRDMAARFAGLGIGNLDLKSSTAETIDIIASIEAAPASPHPTPDSEDTPSEAGLSDLESDDNDFTTTL